MSSGGDVADWPSNRVWLLANALEYIMAGATAVGIGTAWFVDNRIFIKILNGIRKYLANQSTTITKLVGIVHKS